MHDFNTPPNYRIIKKIKILILLKWLKKMCLVTDSNGSQIYFFLMGARLAGNSIQCAN